MSRMVRVSAMSCPPPVPELAGGYGACVAEVIRFWEYSLEKVLPDQPDLIVLPECCDLSNSLTPRQKLDFLEERGTRVQDALARIAASRHVYIAYSSYARAEDGELRNMVRYLDPHGQVAGEYHKNHLVITENEELGVRYGTRADLIQTAFGKVGNAICFDLNFDQLRLRYAEQKPELMVFSSMYHGGLMQPVWAYSCRSYLVSAVAGIGCQMFSPLGELLKHSTNYFPYMTADINLDYVPVHLDFNWPKLDAAKAKYGTSIQIQDPGFLAPVLLTSETDEFSAWDVVREFDIEPLDDYFARSLRHRQEPGRMEGQES